MASTSSFNASDDILQGQKAGGEKLPGTPESAFNKPKSSAPVKKSGGTTAKVSSFTPSAEELAAQRYDTVGAKGTQPGMQNLASKERIVASGTEKGGVNAPVQAPELQASMQRGIEPRSKLTLASQPTEFKMSGTRPGYEYIPQQKSGIFKPRPASATPMGVPVGDPYVKSQSRALAVIPQPKPEPSFTEKMAQGAKYAPPKVGPTMTEKMAGGAKYVPPKVDPYTGEVIKESAPLGSRMASAGKGIIGGFKGTSQKVLKPLLAVNPVVDVALAQQANEGAMRRNVQRVAGGEASPTGAIAQEAALQFMRDPTMALKALGAATGGKTALESEVFNGASSAGTAPTASEKPSEQAPALASVLPGGVVEQAVPVAAEQKKEAPTQFGTSRVTEAAMEQSATPRYTAAQIDEFAKPKAGQSGLQQAVSKGQGGNFRYVQGPNGEIVKQNLDTSEVVPMSVQGITGNVLKPGEESPLAREVRQRKEAAATAREEAFRNALLQMAQSQGDGSFTGMGQAKRDRKMAQQLLSQLDARQQAAAQNALEREKMATTERNTEATREQNQLAKAADQALKQKQIDVAQEGNDLRKQALENKPIRETYKGQTFQGTKASIEQQKADFDKELQAKSWDKANPKPSGLLTTNSDMLKHYQARAKALGYNPDINKASSRATAIANLLGKVSPEQADELSTEFQREYGVPYNEFIMEE